MTLIKNLRNSIDDDETEAESNIESQSDGSQASVSSA